MYWSPCKTKTTIHRSDRKAFQRMVKTAQRIMGPNCPPLRISTIPGQGKKHYQGCTPPGLFTLLPSGEDYRSLHSRTSRLRKSFVPVAVTQLNSTPYYSLLLCVSTYIFALDHSCTGWTPHVVKITIIYIAHTTNCTFFVCTVHNI